MPTNSTRNWEKTGWRNVPGGQMPDWPDRQKFAAAYERLCRLPPLVFAGEARRLKSLLHEACLGKAFVLQAGDCAELFSRCHGPYIRDLLKVILQIAVILTYAGEKRLVNIGRMAGQYAKPRSNSHEKTGDIALPVGQAALLHHLEQ
ncbi:MAG TPA: 3-deoxy-7-phosphoheptulonate synthase, partial [Candidatus Rifleibacterium sp.]|nr:3-deoxy-7-phosphoheptulonate synthase [Candidatus Rifleibacterium sp.]